MVVVLIVDTMVDPIMRMHMAIHPHTMKDVGWVLLQLELPAEVQDAIRHSMATLHLPLQNMVLMLIVQC